MTAYNAAGTPVNLQLRWAKTDSASLGAGHQDTWNLFYQTSTTATGTQAGLGQRRHELHLRRQRRAGLAHAARRSPFPA